jgi:hypothetical protein
MSHRGFRLTGARLLRGVRRRPEAGQVSLLILGFAVIAALLIGGTVAVTSAQVSRMRLLDAADGAALDAADALDAAAYSAGLGSAVTVSDATVRESAQRYLSSRPLPTGVSSWHLGPDTGSPDGETAVVEVVGEARLPMGHRMLTALGGSVTIVVESRARSALE